jgi:hypothetical protein
MIKTKLAAPPEAANYTFEVLLRLGLLSGAAMKERDQYPFPLPCRAKGP